jgi:hypothetical protein
MYWKNGKAVRLDFDYGLQAARANSIALSGDDVYIAGYRVAFSFYRSASSVGLYWKNDVPTELITGSYNQLGSVVISNNDVYTAVLQNLWPGTVAAYLKNGNLVYLHDGSQGSTATAIAVSGSDVYVAGVVIDQNGNGIARYWKNGNPVDLTDGSTNAYTTSIVVSGDDVYVAGVVDEEFDAYSNVIKSTAAYWKNGTLVKLSDGTGVAKSTSIAVSGTDVYVAGYHFGYHPYQNYQYAIASYWKNGVQVSLNDGTAGAVATSIAVSNRDVYVVGRRKITTSFATDGIATYWKNGIATDLTDTSTIGGANSIFLVRK